MVSNLDGSLAGALCDVLSLNILPNLCQHCLDDGSGLLSNRNNISKIVIVRTNLHIYLFSPGREDEAMFAGVWKFNSVTKLYPRPSLGPVITAS